MQRQGVADNEIVRGQMLRALPQSVILRQNGDDALFAAFDLAPSCANTQCYTVEAALSFQFIRQPIILEGH